MSRRGYAVATVVLLAVESLIAAFVDDRFVRPYLGDSLAVVLVYCALRTMTRWRWPVAIGVALAIACVIELGQLAGVLTLLGLDRVPLARVVLGHGFDPQDFLAYAAGALGVAMVELPKQRLSPDK